MFCLWVFLFKTAVAGGNCATFEGFFAFSEPEIVAVRTTVDVICGGAAGDLQFLRQSGINKDSFWLLLGFKFSFFSPHRTEHRR